MRGILPEAVPGAGATQRGSAESAESRRGAAIAAARSGSPLEVSCCSLLCTHVRPYAFASLRAKRNDVTLLMDRVW